MGSFLQLPSCHVNNVYGPTEATITATALYCPQSIEFISIGRPVYNLHAYVVDSALRPLPVGVPGELLLSGPRLALGYSGRADLTEEKFVANPCLDLVSSRVDPALAPYYKLAYRSGDLVRWRGDGSIDFMGRIDRQVKIAGVRIELGEVETALEGVEGVTQAVATALTDPSGQKRLVGYVTPGHISPSSVISHCRSLLVPAMVPTMVVALAAFPLLAGGKIDVRALPNPDWSVPVGVMAGAYEDEGPLSRHAAAVVEIIRNILGMEEDTPVPMKAELFDLGASSIQIAAIVGRIRKELDVNLDMREVYQNPLVEFLCLTVLNQKSVKDGGSKASATGVRHRLLGYPIPAWFIAQAQGAVMRMASTGAQLLAVFSLITCILGCLAPG